MKKVQMTSLSTLSIPFLQRLTIGLFCITCLAHCSVAERAIEEGVRGQVADTGQIPSEETEPTVEETIKINSIQPNRGETIGGTLIELVGLGFEECMQVRLGASQLQCTNLEFLSETSLRCVTPAYPIAERVTVRVIRPASCGEPETAILEGGFEYFEPVELLTVSPDRGPTAGGTLVVVNGRGFVEGTTVQFGAQAALPATLVDSTTVTVATAAMPRDIYAVTVANMNGEATIPAAFTTYEPVRVNQVVPFAGPLSGGTDVTVIGTGFVDPTSVAFGSQSIDGSNNFDQTQFAATTVAAVPAVEGAVNVTATNENGEHTRLNGFIYYDAENTDPRVIGATPNVGLIAGGSTVNLVVAFMPGAVTEVKFGDGVAECQSLDVWMLTCTLPAGSEGVVDITVTAGGQTFTLEDGFTYLDLRLTSASPATGAIAGGTYVAILGNGFQTDTQFYFDGRPARHVTYTDGQNMILWTPPGAVGAVDVRVETLGLEVTAEDFFTYFDPANMNEWTSGEAIDGSVNVTVINSGTGERMPGAFVMAGSSVDEAKPYLSGFTDDQGQITLSGPGLAGTQSIHAGKAEMGNFSWIDVNSENLTMMVTPREPPPPDPLPPCPEPSSAFPPIFRGDVVRIKDKFNTGNDTVVVTTTYADFSQPLPNPGPKSILTSSGEFELISRTGDLVLLALAGTPNADGSLNVHAMGFKPYLFAESSSGDPCDVDADCSDGESCFDAGDANLCIRIYDDIEITIDTPVDQPMRVDLDNPPLGGPFDSGLPTTVAANTWYDFGYMGLHPMSSIRLDGDAANTTFYVDMPKRMPGSLANTPFSISAGVYSNRAGNLAPPQSESRLSGLTDTSETIVLTPFLKTHESVAPMGSVGSPMNFEVNLTPASLPEVFPTTNAHWMFDFEVFVPCEGAMPMQRAIIRWMAFSAPQNTQFYLPVFPATAGNVMMPMGAVYYWQMMALYNPDVSFERMNLNTAFSWQSRALYVSSFNYP